MLKKISLITAIPLILILAIYLLAVWQNNRDISYPQKAQLQKQLEKSVLWLQANETDILTQVNPMLWWMLYEAHKVSGDARLATLLKKYQTTNPQINNSLWAPLFDGPSQSKLGAYSVQGLSYYNQHFIYALNCAKGITDEVALVAQQNEASFCHQIAYFYRPACITHQLMGINFLFSKQCNLLSNIDEVSQSLQLDIVSQLTWDTRVVDVYLQRVLMLLISGAEDSVKAVWIQRILDHQLADGGWSQFVSLLDIGDTRSVGFSARFITIGHEQSDFHATAQGVYLLSYLLAEQP